MSRAAYSGAIGCLVWLAVAAIARAMPMKIDPTPEALLRAIEGHRVVLLGEVHDNPAQHALRGATLRRMLAAGARPAIAFEQFDREHQRDIDRARRERPGDAAYLIAQADGDSGWQWDFYRPIVALALEYDLPIVAANLSRSEAMHVALAGWTAVFDRATVRGLGLDALPGAYRRKQEEAIAAGHCGLLPQEMLTPRANAQIARDIVMAHSIEPYAERGVVLLAGNGHVRRDIGVASWLPAKVAKGAIAIGMVERSDDDSMLEAAAPFDDYVVTEAADRADPCLELKARNGRDAPR